jgi:hypothetical protein
MRKMFSERRSAVLGATAVSMMMLGLAGCSSNDNGSNPSSADNGHAIGWRDTPIATKAPPINVPPGTPVGEDGSTSYAQPTNPLPPGGLAPQPAPANPPITNNNTGP